MKNNRNYSLDVIKLYLSYVVAFYHMERTLPPGGEITIQAYFILFGFFLAKKYYSRSHGRPEEYTAWNYTADHFSSLFPHLFFSVTVYYLYRLARYILVDLIAQHSADWFAQAASDLYLLIPEYTLTLSAYHKFMGANFALWQLSVMMICGYFIYALLCHNEKLSRRLVLPAGILMSLSLMAMGTGLWINFGPIYIPLARGFGPMCIGYFVYFFTTTSAYTSLKQHRFAFDAAAVLALLCIFRFRARENISLLTISFVILNCWAENGILNRLLNHKIFRRSGRLSLAIYLDHMMIARIAMNPLSSLLESRGIDPNGWQLTAIYAVLLTGYSILSMLFVDKCSAAWKKRRAAA